MADWVSIKADYVSGGGSYRALADKYGVNKDAILRHAKAEGWIVEREKQTDKIRTKVVQKTVCRVADQKVDRLTRILSLSDTLLEKAERAAAELDQHLVRNKKRTRTIEYGEWDAKGKPYATGEVIDDIESVDFGVGPIDRMGVKQLASALKDLHEIAKGNEQSGNDEALTKARELLGGVPSAID